MKSPEDPNMISSLKHDQWQEEHQAWSADFGPGLSPRWKGDWGSQVRADAEKISEGVWCLNQSGLGRSRSRE